MPSVSQLDQLTTAWLCAKVRAMQGVKDYEAANQDLSYQLSLMAAAKDAVSGAESDLRSGDWRTSIEGVIQLIVDHERAKASVSCLAGLRDEAQRTMFERQAALRDAAAELFSECQAEAARRKAVQS